MKGERGGEYEGRGRGGEEYEGREGRRGGRGV